MDKTPVMIFFLLLALIVVVYYVGSSSVLLSGAKAGQVLGNTFTGRNAAGQFGGYPNSGAAVFVPAF